MLFNPFPNAFGLDVNDLSVKVVQLRSTSLSKEHMSYELVTARSTRLPHGLVVNGELEQPEQVRKYIQHIIGGTGSEHRPINSRWVVASLSDTKGFIKLIQIDKNPADLIEEDILYTAKKHIPFEDDAYYVDWQIMPYEGSADVSHVLIGAVQKNIADMYTYLIESLGLGVMALELEPLAIARAMITATKTYEGEARAILEMGATRSSLIVYDHHHVQFSRSIPFSGEIMTTAISQKLHIPYEEAEKQKIQFGLDFQQSEAWPILAEIIDTLVDEIQKTIEFYYSHFPHANKITHITMCGGVSLMKKLDEILSLKLKIESAPGHVWKNLGNRKPVRLGDTESLGYTTSIGLALRGAGHPFFIS